jgi:hypothetical protein
MRSSSSTATQPLQPSAAGAAWTPFVLAAVDDPDVVLADVTSFFVVVVETW